MVPISVANAAGIEILINFVLLKTFVLVESSSPPKVRNRVILFYIR